MTPEKLERLRAALPGLKTCTYLNVGSFAIMAQPVLDTLIELTVQCESLGAPAYFEVGDRVEDARAALAGFLGCLPDELAFTENATHSLNIPAFGLPLGPTDAVLMSREEYPIAEHIFRYREQHGGPRVRFFDHAHDPNESFENFLDAWTDDVKLIVVSAVTCETGVRLPVDRMCAVARERGAWSFVDFAQAAGQYPLDLHAIGCDFGAGNGQKWLYGPKGVGLFYSRSDRTADLAPPWISHSAHRDPETQLVTVPTTHRRFELMARTFAVCAVMKDALAWLDAIGWEDIWEHSAVMRNVILEEVEKRGWTLLSPRNFENSSCLITFRVPGVNERNVEEFVADAWKRERLYLRPSTITGGIRLSPAYFTNEADIAHFFRFVDQTGF